MLSKEIKEDIKEINIITATIRKILQKDIKITDEEVYTLDGRQYLVIENILQYIDQLESDKQKLIEKLEEDIRISQKNYETANVDENKEYWRGCINTTGEILKILKGEKE